LGSETPDRKAEGSAAPLHDPLVPHERVERGGDDRPQVGGHLLMIQSEPSFNEDPHKAKTSRAY